MKLPVDPVVKPLDPEFDPPGGPDAPDVEGLENGLSPLVEAGVVIVTVAVPDCMPSVTVYVNDWLPE